ncbi:MAG: hypothetical protein ACYYKD_09355 [Rhodospirillales bacterium]
METLDEGRHTFEFDDGLEVEKLDDAMSGIQGCKSVDFAVTAQDGSVTLIEVKDPSNPRATDKARKKKIGEIISGSFVNEELTPKARDSYTFLHLMKRVKGPVTYVVYIGDEKLGLENALISQISDDLKSRLKKEAKDSWRRPYVRDSVVFLASQSPDTSPFGFRVRRQA